MRPVGIVSLARGRSHRRGDGDVRRDRRHVHGTFLQSEGCREKSRCRTVSRRLPNRSALRASSPPIPAATVSTAGILPDCPEAVFPTVSTHGRGRLSVCRLSFNRLSVTPPLAPGGVGPSQLSQKNPPWVDFFLCGKSLQFCNFASFSETRLRVDKRFNASRRSPNRLASRSRLASPSNFFLQVPSAYSNHHA